MSVNEKSQLPDLLVEEGLPTHKMIPGTGACSISDSIELSRHAVELGCGGVLLMLAPDGLL